MFRLLPQVRRYEVQRHVSKPQAVEFKHDSEKPDSYDHFKVL